MSDADEAGGEVEPAPVDDCPHCGEPVSFAVVTGSQSGTLEPCGCGLLSALLERTREE